MVLRNVRLINPYGDKEGLTNIVIENGKVCAYVDDVDGQGIECCGLYAFPSFFDMHTHLRDPGFTHKENIKTGTYAAAKGGFTAVCCMPNTNPVIDNVQTIEYIKAQKALIDVYPIAAVSKGSKSGELTDFAALKAAGAVAFSDDGMPVLTGGMMRDALKTGELIISHCEDPSLGADKAAEEVMAARDLVLAQNTGGRLHLAHMSTQISVALIREAKARGVKVTAETCPHYFSADSSLVKTKGTLAKVNPPLRSRMDVIAIINGIKDGTIDVIATDHAPHHADEKALEYEKAPMGISGIETAFALSVTNLVKPGYITLEDLVRLMAYNPAKIMDKPGGKIQIGGAANITIADLDNEYTIDALVSRGKNSPFIGQKVYGKVMYTIYNGDIIFKEA